LALASIKLFYSQRLGRFPDVDPTLKMTIFIFPLIFIQICGPIFCSALLAAYFKALVIFFIAFIILSHFLAVKFFYFKGKQFYGLQRLYQDHEYAFSYQKQERGVQDSQSIFITSVATGWITSSTVWSNNLTSHSYFIAISSVTCTLAHCLCFSCLYVFTMFEELQITNSLPVTHCFPKYDDHQFVLEEKPIFNLIRICNANESCQTVQVLKTHYQPGLPDGFIENQK
jgi:hypothetical protein